MTWHKGTGSMFQLEKKSMFPATGSPQAWSVHELVDISSWTESEVRLEGEAWELFPKTRNLGGEKEHTKNPCAVYFRRVNFVLYKLYLHIIPKISIQHFMVLRDQRQKLPWKTFDFMRVDALSSSWASNLHVTFRIYCRRLRRKEQHLARVVLRGTESMSGAKRGSDSSGSGGDTEDRAEDQSWGVAMTTEE